MSKDINLLDYSSNPNKGNTPLNTGGSPINSESSPQEIQAAALNAKYNPFGHSTAPLTDEEILQTPRGIYTGKELNIGKYLNTSLFDKLGYSLVGDNENEYYEAQPWYKQAGNAIVQTGAQAFQAFGSQLNKVEQIKQTFGNSSEDYLEDQFEFSEKLREQFPVFKSANEHSGIIGYVPGFGAGSKWSNFIPNLGFTLGTMLGVAVENAVATALIEAASLGTGTPLAAAKIGKNTYDAYNKISKFHKLTKLAQKGGKAYVNYVKKFGSAGNIIRGAEAFKNGQYLLGTLHSSYGAYQLYSNSAGEALIENSHVIGESLGLMTEHFKELNGRDPNEQELTDMREVAEDAVLPNTWGNIAVLMASNSLQQFNAFKGGKILGSIVGQSGKKGLGLLTKDAIKRVTLDKAKGTFRTLTSKEAAKLYGKSLLVGGTGILSEGLEESAQGVIAKASTEMVVSRYKGIDTDFFSNIGAGLSYAVSEEGREEFWAGIVTGALFQGGGRAINTYKKRQESKALAEKGVTFEMYQQKIVDELNSGTAFLERYNFITGENVSNYNSQTILETKIREAQEAGDTYSEEVLKKLSLSKSVFTAVSYGKENLLLDKYKDLAELSDEDLSAYMGVGVDEVVSLEERQKFVQELEQAIKETKTILKSKPNPYRKFNPLDPQFVIEKDAESTADTSDTNLKTDELKFIQANTAFEAWQTAQEILVMQKLTAPTIIKKGNELRDIINRSNTSIEEIAAIMVTARPKKGEVNERANNKSYQEAGRVYLEDLKLQIKEEEAALKDQTGTDALSKQFKKEQENKVKELKRKLKIIESNKTIKQKLREINRKESGILGLQIDESNLITADELINSFDSLGKTKDDFIYTTNVIDSLSSEEGFANYVNQIFPAIKYSKEVLFSKLKQEGTSQETEDEVKEIEENLTDLEQEKETLQEEKGELQKSKEELQKNKTTAGVIVGDSFTDSLTGKGNKGKVTSTDSVDEKADIERLEKEIEQAEKDKSETLQPLIEEKEQIEKEIEEIKEDSSKSNSEHSQGVSRLLGQNISEQAKKIIKAFSRDTSIPFEYIAKKVEEKTGEKISLDDKHIESDNLLKKEETAKKDGSQKEYENKLKQAGIELEKENSIKETSAILEKLGISRQAKLIWNLISKVAEKLGVTVIFSESKDFDTRRAAGIYFLGSHKIYVDARKLKFGKDKAISKTTVHEVVHGVTRYITKIVQSSKIKYPEKMFFPSKEAKEEHEENVKRDKENLEKLTKKQIKAVENLNALLEELGKDENLKGEYGLTNVDELLAELANEEFVTKLKAKKFKGNESFFDKIVSYITDLLGLNVSAYDIVLESLEALIESANIETLSASREGVKSSEFSKSESTKLQQLKQRLAEVNKKIDEVTKRFDSQIAQKKAELKASKETTSNQSEIEAKKVKIERLEKEIEQAKKDKSETLQPLIEEKEQIEKEVQEIEEELSEAEKLEKGQKKSESTTSTQSTETKKTEDKVNELAKELKESENENTPQEVKDLNQAIQEAVDTRNSIKEKQDKLLALLEEQERLNNLTVGKLLKEKINNFFKAVKEWLSKIETFNKSNKSVDTVIEEKETLQEKETVEFEGETYTIEPDRRDGLTIDIFDSKGKKVEGDFGDKDSLFSKVFNQKKLSDSEKTEETTKEEIESKVEEIVKEELPNELKEEPNKIVEEVAEKPVEKIEEIVEQEITEEEVAEIAEEENIPVEEVKEKIAEEVVSQVTTNKEPSKLGTKIKAAVQKVIKYLKKAFLIFFVTSLVTGGGTVVAGKSGVNINPIIEVTLQMLPDIEAQSALRLLVKQGLYDPSTTEEVVVDVKAAKERDLKAKSDSVYAKNNTYTETVGIVKDSHYKARKGKADSFIMIRNQYMNSKGFNYVTAPIKSKIDKYHKTYNVKGVAHFMILDDQGADLSNKTSAEELQAASEAFRRNRIGNDIKDNDYVPVFKKLGNNTVNTSYKKAKDLDSSDLILTKLNQVMFGNIDFNSKVRDDKQFGKGIYSLTTYDGKMVQSLLFTDAGKSAYSRFSGGSVVFIFTDKKGNEIVRDFSGSIDMIKKEGNNIAKVYDLDKNNITIGFYDAGSYTGKPAANAKGEVDYQQYKGFNITQPNSGGALMIPADTDNTPTDPIQAGLFGLLGLFKGRRKKGENILDEEINTKKDELLDRLNTLKQRLEEANKKIDEVTKRFDSQIAQKKAELKALEESTNQSTEDYIASEILLDQINNRIAEIDERIAEIDAEIFKLKERLKNLSRTPEDGEEEEETENTEETQEDTPKEGVTKEEFSKKIDGRAIEEKNIVISPEQKALKDLIDEQPEINSTRVEIYKGDEKIVKNLLDLQTSRTDENTIVFLDALENEAEEDFDIKLYDITAWNIVGKPKIFSSSPAVTTPVTTSTEKNIKTDPDAVDLDNKEFTLIDNIVVPHYNYEKELHEIYTKTFFRTISAEGKGRTSVGEKNQAELDRRILIKNKIKQGKIPQATHLKIVLNSSKYSQSDNYQDKIEAKKIKDKKGNIKTPSLVSIISDANNNPLFFSEEGKVITKEEAEKLAKKNNIPVERYYMIETLVSSSEDSRTERGIKDSKTLSKKDKIEAMKQADSLDLIKSKLEKGIMESFFAEITRVSNGISKFSKEKIKSSSLRGEIESFKIVKTPVNHGEFIYSDGRFTTNIYMDEVPVSYLDVVLAAQLDVTLQTKHPGLGDFIRKVFYLPKSTGYAVIQKKDTGVVRIWDKKNKRPLEPTRPEEEKIIRGLMQKAGKLNLDKTSTDATEIVIFDLKDGKIEPRSPISYTDFVINNSTTDNNNDGKKEQIYFNFDNLKGIVAPKRKARVDLNIVNKEDKKDSKKPLKVTPKKEPSLQEQRQKELDAVITYKKWGEEEGSIAVDEPDGGVMEEFSSKEEGDRLLKEWNKLSEKKKKEINDKYDALEFKQDDNVNPDSTSEIDDDDMLEGLDEAKLEEDTSRPLRENFEEDEAFIQKAFKNVPVIINNFNFLKGIVNSKAYGTWSKSATNIYADSDSGTTQHESWHNFSQFMLTKEEKTNLYEELLKVNKALQGENLTKLQQYVNAEEELATDFVEYIKSKKVLKGRPVRNVLFRRLLKLLDALLSFFNYDSNLSKQNNLRIALNELYDGLIDGNLEQGDFSYENVMFTNVLKQSKQFSDLLNSSVLAQSNPQQAMNAVYGFLDYELAKSIIEASKVKTGGYIDINSIKDLKASEFFDEIYEDTEKSLDSLRAHIKRLVSNKNTPKKYKTPLRNRLELLDAFKNDFQSIFSQFLKEREYIINTDDTIEVGFNEDGEFGFLVEDEESGVSKALTPEEVEAKNLSWSLDGNEKTTQEASSILTRFIMRGIPALNKREGEDVYNIKINKYGFIEMANENVMWNTISNKVANLTELQDFYDKLLEISDIIPEALFLLRQIPFKDESFVKRVNGKINKLITKKKFDAFKIKPAVLKNQKQHMAAMSVKRLVFQDFKRYRVPEKISQLIDTEKNKFEARLYDGGSLSLKVIEGVAYSNIIKAVTLGTKGIAEYYKNGELDLDKFKALPKSEENAVQIFKILGLEISELVLNDPKYQDINFKEIFKYYDSLQEYNQAVGNRTKKVNDKTVSLRLSITNPIEQRGIYRTTFVNKKPIVLEGVKSYMDQLLNIVVKHTPDLVSNSVTSSTGKIYNELSQPTYTTQILSALNDSKNYPTLFGGEKGTNLVDNPMFMHFDPRKFKNKENSAYLASLFNLKTGKRLRNRQTQEHNIIDIFNFNSYNLTDMDKNNKSTLDVIPKMGTAAKLIYVDMPSLINNNKKENIRTADKNRAFGLDLNSSVFENTKIVVKPNVGDYFKPSSWFYQLMFKYLKYEIDRIETERATNKGIKDYSTRSTDFVIFADILEKFDSFKEEFTSEDFSSPKFKNYFSDKLMKFFQNDQKDFIKDNFTKNGLSIEVLNRIKFNVNNYGKELSPKELITFFLLKDFVYNVEETLFLYEDPSYYKDPIKRLAMFSSNGPTPIVNKELEDFFRNEDKNYKLATAKAIGRKNVNKFDGTFNAGILEDLPVKVEKTDLNSLYNQFKDKSKKEIFKDANTNEDNVTTDAAAMATFDFYRIVAISLEKWSPKQETLYEKINRGDTLSPEDIAFFPVLKLGYTGPSYSNDNDQTFSMTYHKYAISPLIPGAYDGDSSINDILKEMHLQQLDYVTFQSAAKVGSFKANKLYDENGRVNSSIKGTKLFIGFLKTQLNTEPKQDDSTIFGSQVRKSLFSDFFENGNFQNKEIKKLYQNYKEAIKQLSEKSLKKLESKGILIDSNSDEAIIVDFEKFTDVLKTRVKLKGLDDDAKEFLDDNKNKNNFRSMLESTKNAFFVDKIISAMVNNDLIVQKLHGESMVQVSEVGHSVLSDKFNKSKLKGYRFEKGKLLPAEVLISFNLKSHRALLELNYNNKPIKVVDETSGYKVDIRASIRNLNKALKDKNWADKHAEFFRMVGYRIPTQGLQSIDLLTIKGFLSPETGNQLVLPGALLIKTGSDYDIDKMFVFKPELFTETVNPNKIFDKHVEAINKLSEEKGNPIIVKKSNNTSNKVTNTTVLSAIEEVIYFGDTSGDTSGILENTAEVMQTSVEQVLMQAQQEFIAKVKVSPTNEIIKTAFELLSRPEVIEKMQAPLTNFILDRVFYKLDIDKQDRFDVKTKMFSKVYINKKREDLFSGKRQLGIAAISNVINQLLKLTDVKLNDTYKDRYDGEMNTNIYMNAHIRDGKHSISEIDTVGGISKTDILVQLISAFVDIANDDSISKLGVNYNNTPVITYMTLLGINPEDAFALINLESVKIYSHLESKSPLDLLGKQNIVKPLEITRKRLQKLYASEENSEKDLQVFETLTKIFLNPKLKSLTRFRRTVNEILSENIPQLQDLKDFDKLQDPTPLTEFLGLLQYIELKEQANQFRDKFQSLINHDTTNVASTIEAVVLDEMRTRILMKDDGLVSTSDFNKIFKDSPISSLYHRTAVKSLFKGIYPLLGQDVVINKVLTILQLTNSSPSSYANVSRKVLNDTITFAIHNSKEGREYSKLVDARNDNNIQVQYLKVISLLGLYKFGVDETKLIRGFKINKSEDNNLILLKFMERSLDSEVTNDYKEAWINLSSIKNQLTPIKGVERNAEQINEDSDLLREFLTNLAKAKIFSYGLNLGKNSFWSLIPNQKFESILEPIVKRAVNNKDFEAKYNTLFIKLFKRNNLSLYEGTEFDVDTRLDKYFRNYEYTGEGLKVKSYEDTSLKEIANSSEKEVNNLPTPIDKVEDNRFLDEKDKSFEDELKTTVSLKNEGVSKFTRKSVEKDSDYLYIFTDNAGRTSGTSKVDPNSDYAKYFGIAGNYPTARQAVIRGLNNAAPITTMVNDKKQQWKESQLEEYKKIINQEIDYIIEKLSTGKFKGVKYSNKSKIGKGTYSNLPENLQEYLDSKLKEIGINNDFAVKKSPRPAKPKVKAEQKSKQKVANKSIKSNVVVNGMTLTTDQVTALEEINSFLNDPDKSSHSLVGAAGTGKTTLIDLIKKEFEKNHPFNNLILSSPTHRANSVLKLKSNSNVTTLHSLLGLSLEQDLDTFDADNAGFKSFGKVKLGMNDVVIIDEASMINDSLYQTLIDLVERENIKILFVGDSAQLKPVKQSHLSKALTSTDKISQLDTIVRTSSAPLLEESIHVRETGNFTYQQKIEDLKGVGFTKDRAEFLGKATKLFQSEAFETNPLLVRVLSGTNAGVAATNKVIRKAIYGAEAPELVAGEIIMGYNNWSVDYQTKDPLLNNGGDYKVLRVSEKKKELIEKVEVEGFEVEIQNIINPELRSFKAFALSKDNSKETLDKLGNKYEELRLTALKQRKGSADAARAWKALSNFKDSFITTQPIRYKGYTKIGKTFDYGYSHTIHKSQGGTYKYSFVIEATINSFPDSESRKQLKYVALTRASDVAYVLQDTNSSKSFNKQANLQEERPEDEEQVYDKDPKNRVNLNFTKKADKDDNKKQCD